MQSQTFILAITCYLVSLVAGLTGSFFSRLIPSRFIVILIVIHFLLLFGWLLSSKADNYMFLSFFCIGIITAGLVLRIAFPIYVKIYFALFLVSLPVFVISPSRLLGFIATGNFHTVDPKRLHVAGNYFLVEQQESTRKAAKDSTIFKLVREMGMFHSTLVRDISLPQFTDSVKNLSPVQESPVLLRTYFHNNQKTDSADVVVILGLRDSSREIQQIHMNNNSGK